MTKHDLEPVPAFTLPRVVGNALICSDGTTHQLRLLEKLYFACGIITLQQLNDQYRGRA